MGKKIRKRKTITRVVIVTKTEVPAAESHFKQKTAELNAMLKNAILR